MSSSPVIVLTGGSRGLGLAILRILLSRHNARVTTMSRSRPAQLDELSEQYRDRCSTEPHSYIQSCSFPFYHRFMVVQGDVGSLRDNKAIIQQTVDRWGGIDGLILCAGSLIVDRISDLDLEDAPAYTSANLLSSLYLVQPSLPQLRKSKGKVIFVSSGASTKGYEAWGLYSMVKAGMNSIARTLAEEERPNGIGVWAIRPGLVDTSMQVILRERGPGRMSTGDVERFQTVFEGGKLLDASEPGAVIADLVIHGGPEELSGEYLEWNDPRLRH